MVPHCPLLQSPPLPYGVALSIPAMSTLAISCRYVHSCIFHTPIFDRAALSTPANCINPYYPYSTFIILRLTKGKGFYMALESLLSCISPFLRHLRNQLPWISRRGHSRLYILAAIKSPCTTLYRLLIVTFALSSTVSEILPVLYAPSQLCK